MGLRNLKIGKKIFILIMASVIFLVITGATGAIYMNQMEQNSKMMYDNNLLPIAWLDQIRSNNRAIDSYMLELLITKDPVVNKDLQTKTEEKLASTKQLISQYKKTKLDSVEKEKLAEFEDSFEIYSNNVHDVEHLAVQNKNDEAYAMYTNELQEIRSAVNDLAKDISGYKIELADKLNEESTAQSNQAVLITILVLIIAIVLCTFIGFVITRMIATPLKDLQNLMGKAENGDFTVKGAYRSKDELGLVTASFNKMMSGLRGVVKQVTEASEQVAASSEELMVNADETSRATEQIAVTIQEVATGSDRQLQSVEETSQTIHELSAGVHQIAASTQHLSASAGDTSEKAVEGDRLITKAVNQMESIHQTFDGLSESIKGLGERSKEIGQIVGVITDIASQTNLLALNAAIEAARAGEHGRGFAVVADEVRKLAEQSAQSSQQIAQLVTAIQSQTETTVNSMDQATAEVSEGINVVNTAGDSFKHIQSLINKVAGQIHEISAAVEEMSAGTEQVVNVVTDINKVAENTASGTQNVSAAAQEQTASMEEISASSASLAKMAEELQIAVEKFKI